MMLRVLAAITAVAVAGCATPRSYFTAKKSTMDNFFVCKVMRDAIKLNDRAYVDEAAAEMRSRGLTLGRCDEMEREQREAALNVLGVVAVIGLGVAAAKYGTHVPAPGSRPASGTGFAWDEIRAPEGFGTIWVCRDASNGQFAHDSFCSALVKIDSTWPGLDAPR